jgi:hypothetical protein
MASRPETFVSDLLFPMRPYRPYQGWARDLHSSEESFGIRCRTPLGGGDLVVPLAFSVCRKIGALCAHSDSCARRCTIRLCRDPRVCSVVRLLKRNTNQTAQAILSCASWGSHFESSKMTSKMALQLPSTSILCIKPRSFAAGSSVAAAATVHGS